MAARDNRVVLAYSGGLDTTVAVPWLKANKGLDVIAAAVDVGQLDDTEALVAKALDAGAADALVVDARDEFADEFVTKALAANALYQDKYPLVSALSRPLICKHLVQIATETGAGAIAHGCTGKGNDQVRFEVALGALAPDLDVLAPVRDLGWSREQSLEYAAERGIPVSIAAASPYSIDENMWGRTIECGALENPWTEAPDDVWERTGDINSAPAEPTYTEVGFENGMPVSLDGHTIGLAELVSRIDKLAGSYGFGRIDMIEDRVVGIKSREVYEVPGALTLIKAHQDLEELTLERDVLRLKRSLERRWADLVYEGLWFSPLREAIDAFIENTQRSVGGVVRLKFQPGSVAVAGRRSDNSLYEAGLASYTKDDTFDHSASAGFVKLWGLPTKIWGSRRSAAHASENADESVSGAPQAPSEQQ